VDNAIKTEQLRSKINVDNYATFEGKELGNQKIIRVYQRKSKQRNRITWMAEIKCKLCGKIYTRPCNTLGRNAACRCVHLDKHRASHFYWLIKSKSKEDSYRVCIFDAVQYLEFQDDIRAFAKRGELADVPHKIVMTKFAVMILPHMTIVSRRIAKLLTRERLLDIQTWLQYYISQRKDGCYSNVLNEDLLTDDILCRWEIKQK
jgi:hypothetical protein